MMDIESKKKEILAYLAQVAKKVEVATKIDGEMETNLGVKEDHSDGAIIRKYDGTTKFTIDLTIRVPAL